MATKVRQLANKGIIAPHEDATKRVCIVVTKLDCKNAMCFAPDECVLAKATARAFPNVIRAFFYRGSAYVAFGDPATGKPTKTVRYQPSPNAAKSIDSFDHKQGFLPGRYWLEVPKGSNTSARIEARGKKRLGKRHEPTGKGTSRRPLREVQPQKMTRLLYAFPY